MKGVKARIFSAVLSMAMLLSLFPATVFAGESEAVNETAQPEAVMDALPEAPEESAAADVSDKAGNANAPEENAADDFFKVDNQFHDTIAGMAKNPLADKINRVVRTLTYAMRYETVSTMIRGGRGAELIAAHEKLLSALKQRDLSDLSAVVRDSYFGEVLRDEA